MIITQEKDIYVQFLGGASEVGATCIYIYWKGKKILIDSGKRRSGNNHYPIFDEIDKDVDLFILTHLHGDHVGSYMEILEKLNIKRVVTSKENKECIKIILEDSQKIMRKDNNTSEEIKNLYSDEKIKEAVDRIEVIKYDKKLSLGELKLSFIQTSHLMGSFGVYFESPDYSLLHTSDFTESQKFFHPKTEFLSELKGKDIDTIITETTYGQNIDADEVLKDNCLNDLAHSINEVFKDNGNILIPCFANGRMQEVILAILKLIVSGRIDRDTKISMFYNWNNNLKKITNLGGNITEKYFEEYFEILRDELRVNNRDYFSLIEKNSKEKNLKNGHKSILREFLEGNFLNICKTEWDLNSDFIDKKKTIFLIQPGMLGSATETNEDKQKNGKLALEIMEGTKNGLIFVGYQSPGTAGKKIKETILNGTCRVYGKTYTRKNKNISSISFPGHASIAGVVELVKELTPENIILVHGDIDSSKNMAKGVDRKNILIPEIDEKIYLMDNNKKMFFSMHHKFSKIVVDLGSKYTLESKNDKVLEEEKYEDYKVIKLLKDEYFEKIDRDLLSIEFIIGNRESIPFYEKLKKELKAEGIASNLNIVVNESSLIENLAKLVSDTNEKSSLYLIDYSFDMIEEFIILGQMADLEIYFYEGDHFEKLLNLPFDIAPQNKIQYENKIELEQLIEKMEYYHGKRTKKEIEREEKYVQRPDYNIDKPIYKKNLFYSKDKSLWGDIATLLEIKNRGVVKDFENIYDKLNERIESIVLTNYEYSYFENKEYREIIGIDKNKIYGKFYLESGIQLFTINLKKNILAKDVIGELDRYVEFVGGR